MFQLHKGANGACGDDTTTLKKKVVDWLHNIYGPLDLPISSALKSGHDLEHDVIHRSSSLPYRI